MNPANCEKNYLPPYALKVKSEVKEKDKTSLFLAKNYQTSLSNPEFFINFN